MMDQNGSGSIYRQDNGAIRGPWYLNGNWRFLLFNAVFVAVFFGLLRDLMLTSWNSNYYTYIPFIPFISAYLFHEDRQAIFSRKGSSFVPGLLVMGVGILLLFILSIAGCAGSGAVQDPVEKIKEGIKDASSCSVILEDMREEGVFSTKYFHKYRVIKDVEGSVTDWMEVSEDYYKRNENFLARLRNMEAEKSEHSANRTTFSSSHV